MTDVTLVTGATGFIGSHLTKLLLRKGEKTRVLVRTPDKLRAFGLDKRGLEVIRGDLLKPGDVSKALDGVDRLYHIAGFISTHPEDRTRLRKLNYDITYNLFEECRERGMSQIVYLASIFALGGGGKEPVDENIPYNLNDLDVTYVKVKRKAELYVEDRIEEGLPVVRVYPCYCYGPGDINNSSSRLILSYLNRSLPGYIRGGQNVMDVRDAARGLYLGMKKGKEGEKYLVGGNNMSYELIFNLLEELTGYPKPRLRMSRGMGKLLGYLNQALSSTPAIDKEAADLMGHYWYYDDSKARKELGYSSRPVEETFRDAIYWFCTRDMAPWPAKMKKSNGKKNQRRKL